MTTALKLTGLFGLAAAGSIAAFIYAAENQDLEFPACTAPDDIDINYVLQREVPFTRSPGIAVAVPGRDDEFNTVITARYIVYNPYDTLFMNQYEQLFLFLHECAHHRLGHHERLFQTREIEKLFEIREIELAADCYAAANMRSEYSLSDDEIMQGLSLIKNTTGGVTHPSGKDRLESVTSCLAKPNPAP